MERFFRNPHTLLSKRESPLGPYIDEFAQQLCEQGYSRQYARRRLQLVAELSQWLRQQDLVVSDLTSMHLESYLEFKARSRRTRPGDAASLKAFLELLQQKNRHTYSTLLRSVGTEFKVMQELLRHSSFRSTLDVYTQAVTPAKHAAQAAVMSLVFSSDKDGTALVAG